MLDAQLLVLDLIRALRPLVARLRTTSPDLATQIVRAATGVGLNLAEGEGRYGADDCRSEQSRLASAEAKEVKAALEIAAAWGALDDAELVAARPLADRVARVTFALGK